MHVWIGLYHACVDRACVSVFIISRSGLGCWKSDILGGFSWVLVCVFFLLCFLFLFIVLHFIMVGFSVLVAWD